MIKKYELVFSMVGGFAAFEATPALMQKYTNIFISIGALPSTIQTQNVSPNGVTNSYRPQFISIQDNYKVNFLPDRVEIVFSQKDDEDLNLEEKSSIANSIFNLLGDIINNRTNRMVFVLKSYNETKLMNKLIDKSLYFSDHDTIEWGMRTAHRRSILINGLNEDLNVVIDQSHPEQGIIFQQTNKVKAINGIHCQLEINTVQFNTINRFLVENYSEFVLKIKGIVYEVIKKIEGEYTDEAN